MKTPSSTLTPVDAVEPSQVDRCYALLREWIVRCKLPPGLRVNERDLIEQTGFGRTPVREALLRLGHDGLVITLPRSGYLITPLTEKTINDVYEVWTPIATLIVKRAMECRTPELMAEVMAFERAHRPKRRKSGLDNFEASLILDSLFSAFARATANDELIHIYHRLSGSLERMFTLYLSTDQGATWHSEAARDLAKLAQLNDPKFAVAATARGIRKSHLGILQAFRRLNKTGPVKGTSSTPRRA